MKKKDLESLRPKKVDELFGIISKKRLEILKHFSEKPGKDKNVKVARVLRREIAQIKTILKEKNFMDIEKK